MANIAQLLTDHMAIWTAADTEKKSGRGRASGNAGSVHGVKKLRELILELAVRGKLIPQNANDEPASELLKRIQAEKTKLIAEGKLKKEKPFTPIGEDEKCFELPKGWVLVRNCELFQLRKGRIPKSLNEDGIGLPYLDIEALDRNVVRRYSEELTCPQSTQSDILVVCDGSRSGLVLDGKNGIIGSTLSIIDTPIYIQNYIKLIFKQGFEIFNTSMKGAAIPHLDTQKLLQNPTALPPFAEQHRIVTKVDELMVLCDQLEQQHSNAQAAHETLVSQLLAMLTQSQNATEFNSNWQRIYAHFDVLFTTEASIDALKQTLLQLAFMGKLVPQDPNGEHASELLKRIQAEKAKLIAEGKLNKQRPLQNIGDEVLFQLPSSWTWCRLGNLLEIVSDYHANGSYEILKKNVELLDNKDYAIILRTTNFSEKNYDAYKYISEKAYNFLNKSKVFPGDIIVNKIGDPGAAYFVDDRGQPMSLAMNLFLLRALQINSKFLYLYLKSEYDYVSSFAGGTSTQTITKDVIENLLFPLCPLSEQHRIVAKVDALVALCDQLKTRIQQANQQQQAIADALVAQALKPSNAEIIDLASYRAAIASYAISKMQNSAAFGRTQAMKLLYLSQNHLGLEMNLHFEREAAGPFTKWIYEFERLGEQAKWFTVIEKSIGIGKTKVEYQVKSAITEPSGLIDTICSEEQRKELDRMLALFADINTEEAEIIATLYAVWNDFLIDAIVVDDAQIIKELRENWHVSKARFSPSELTKWLSWMRSHQLVPQGRLPHTVYQPSLIN